MNITTPALLALFVTAGLAQDIRTPPNYRIENLSVTEIVKDPANFISEASIDSRGNEVVVVYVRHPGLRHSDDGSIMFVASHDGGKTWDLNSLAVAMPQSQRWGFTSAACLILKDGTILAFAVANTA